ncbi:MAG: tRNA (5-methylaminomethyl-2-thiouridine)(34)-methyltransferase MnmD [Bacteroidales bacterium]|nr:tRNA (5-methylaminomethyl-2-thiouridine)(34)-methyltransferase MnmD [Bacteroidales bacterium]
MEASPTLRVCSTEDGSQTLLTSQWDESYHSIHGAIQESRHVFLNAGLDYLTLASFDVLEIGFGTGLNAFLAWDYAREHDKMVHYTSIERFPVPCEMACSLNYPQKLHRMNRTDWACLHRTPWGEWLELEPNRMYIHKIEADATRSQYPENQYDAVFFDAFSPQKQPELWTRELLHKMYATLRPGGVLVTYCAMGAVRRNLQACGFRTERLPGPPGKREMLRASKP